VIPPGAGGDQYHAGANAVDVDPRARVLLSVSRLADRYKGHDMVLRALPLIRARVPDVEYVVVGDGPLRPYLERMASALGVDDVVRFVGEVDARDLDRWYRRCDLFLLMSREERSTGGAEGYGLVFIEAALRGKAVIGGRSGGIPDAVVEGVTGLLVDPLNPVGIADAAIALLSDPGRAAALGASGRARAETELAWPGYIIEFRSVLDSIVSSRPA
jgi:phosphatidylinositol alpha-1,6-mannosyltransferase